MKYDTIIMAYDKPVLKQIPLLICGGFKKFSNQVEYFGYQVPTK